MSYGMGGMVEVVISLKVRIRHIHAGERPTDEEAMEVAREHVLYGDGRQTWTPHLSVGDPEILFTSIPSKRKKRRK